MAGKAAAGNLVFGIQFENSSAMRNINLTKREIRGLTNEMKGQESAFRANGQAMEALSTRADGLAKAIERQKYLVEEAKKAQMAAAQDEKLSTAEKGRYTNAVREAETRLGQFERQLERTQRVMATYDSALIKTRTESGDYNKILSATKKELEETGKGYTKSAELTKAYNQNVISLKSNLDAEKRTLESIRKLDNETNHGIASHEQLEQIARVKRTAAAYEAARREMREYTSGYKELSVKTKAFSENTEALTSALRANNQHMTANVTEQARLRQGQSELAQKAQLERRELDEIGRTLGTNSTAYEKQAKKVNETTGAYNANAQRIKVLNREVGAMSVTQAKSADRFANAGERLNSWGNKWLGVAQKASGATMAVGAAFLYGAKKNIELQDTYIKTQNLVEQDSDSVSQLTSTMSKHAAAIKLTNEMQKSGAKYSMAYGESQKKIGDEYQELVKRGYTAQQSIGAMKPLLQASIASGDDLASTTKTVTSAVESFGLRSKSSAQMLKNTKDAATQMSFAANKTATDFGSMGTAMEYVGNASHQAGFSLHETAAAIGILSNNGLEADKAGTGLRKTINSLISPTENGAGALKQLGLSTKDFVGQNGKMKSMTDIFSLLNSHMKDLNGKQRNDIFHALFGTTGQAAGGILVQNSQALKELDNQTKASSEHDYLGSLARKNQNSLKQQLKIFKSTADGIAVSLAKSWTPTAERLLKSINKIMKGFNNMSSGSKKWASVLMLGIPALTATGAAIGLITKSLGAAAKGYGSVIKGVTGLAKFMVAAPAQTEKVSASVLEEAKAYETLTKSVNSATEAQAVNSKASAGGAAATTHVAQGPQFTGKGIAGGKGQLVKTGLRMGGELAAGMAAFDFAGTVAGTFKHPTAKNKSKLAGKGVGAGVGAGIGAVLGSVVPGIGTATGVMLGGSIGEYIGSTKYGQKLGKWLNNAFGEAKKGIKPIKAKVKVSYDEKQVDKATRPAIDKLNKAFEIKMSADPKSYASTKQQTDVLFNEMYESVDNYYNKKQQKQAKDLQAFVKAGYMTQKQANEQLKKSQENNDKERQAKKKQIKAMQDDSANYYKTVQNIQNGGSKTLQQIAQKYGTQSKQYEREKNKELNQAHKAFMKQYTKDQFAMNKSLTTNDKQGAKDQESILKQLIKKRGDLSKKQLENTEKNAKASYKAAVEPAKKAKNEIIKHAEEQYKSTKATAKHQYQDLGTISYKQYKDIVKKAKDQRDGTRKAADEQYKGVTKSSTKQYKAVMRELTRQKADAIKQATLQKNGSNQQMRMQAEQTIKNIDKQVGHVKKKTMEQELESIGMTKKQADVVIQNARNQKNGASKHAQEQKDSVSKHADNQRKNVSSAAEQQRKTVSDRIAKQSASAKKSAESQSRGVSQHGVNEANNQLKAAAKSTHGVTKAWHSVGKFFNNVMSLFKKKPIESGNIAPDTYTPVSIGAVATGGRINSHGKALVGEAGPEMLYRPYSNQVNFLGVNGPEIATLKPGDQILNASDTAKVITGTYGKKLPGYAGGTIDLSGFMKSISDTTSKIWDSVSDKAEDFFDKLGDPLKKIKGIISSAFNFDTIAEQTQRNYSKSSNERVVDAFTDSIKKIKKAFDDGFGDAGGQHGNPGGSGVQRWKKLAIKALRANKLSTSLVGKVLAQIDTESGGNPKAKQPGADPDGDGSGPAMGLMQTKRSTFKAYAFPGHGDIYNGYDSLLAGLAYAKARYGPGLSFLGQGHGYANGGIVNSHQMIEVGENNMPEAVVPLTKGSRAWKLLQQVINSYAGDNSFGNQSNSIGISGHNGSDSIDKLSDKMDILISMFGQLLGISGAQLQAIKDGQDPKRRYQLDGLNNSMLNWQTH